MLFSLRLCLLLPLFCLLWGPVIQLQAQQAAAMTETFFHQEELSRDYVLVHYDRNFSRKDVEQQLKESGIVFNWQQSVFFDASGNLLLKIGHENRPSTHERWQQIKQTITDIRAVIRVNPCFQKNDQPPVAVLNTVFVKPKPHISGNNVQELVRQFQGLTVASHPSLADVYEVNFEEESVISPFAFTYQMHEHPAFEYVEPDLLFSPVVARDSTDDPLFARQWHVQNKGTAPQHNGTADADMDVTEAWDITTGSPSITIGLLDSGVDSNQTDLQTNLLAQMGYDATDRNRAGFPSDSFPQDAHGTACAGILAAEANNQQGVAGVAHNCKIVPIRVFYYVDIGGNFGIIPFSEISWMTDGINYASQQAKADVLSNSWGVPDTLFPLLPGNPATLNDALEDAATKGRNGLGLPMLFSTGNENKPNPIWPSRRPNTIAVTATSMCDERKSPSSCDGESWWGGHYGGNLDVGAPGVKIPTTDRPGPLGYEPNDTKLDFNGTSAACPNAAAVVALMLSVNPDLSLYQVRDILASTADTVGGYAYDSTREFGQWSKQLGYGRVNAFQAIQKASKVVGIDDDVANEEASSINMALWPNPTRNNITLSLTPPRKGRLSVSLFNVTGRQEAVLLQQDVHQREQQFHFSLDRLDLPPGLHFLSVRINGQRYLRKLIIH